MILVACELSGTVRDALIKKGLPAVSCDLEPSEKPGPHIQGNVLEVIHDPRWKAVIGFPPCTDLCVSGARWFAQKRITGQQQKSIEFFMQFTGLQCPYALENPVGIMSTYFRKPDQIIHPWQFGHGETKATCLWLNGLPLLQPSRIVHGRIPRTHYMAPGPDRARERSRTFSGVAEAMAEQWWLELKLACS